MFGERLKKARKLKNLSQSELAEMAGVTYESISRWERGTRQPKVEDARMLAKILGVSVSFLLDEYEMPHSAGYEFRIAPYAKLLDLVRSEAGKMTAEQKKEALVMMRRAADSLCAAAGVQLPDGIVIKSDGDKSESERAEADYVFRLTPYAEIVDLARRDAKEAENANVKEVMEILTAVMKELCRHR